MIKQAVVMLVFFAAPAGAQQLAPQVATPLLMMMQAAATECQAGNMEACEQAQRMQQAGNQLAHAQFACRQGNGQACQIFQQGAQQVFIAYQQHLAAIGVQPPAPPSGIEGGVGPGYSQEQMTLEHQQRMREMERNARAQQRDAAAASAQRDRDHQRFMDQLRR